MFAVFFKKNNFKINLLLIILISLTSANIFAQNAQITAQFSAQELRLGSVIAGNLNSAQEIWYSVTADGSGILTIETRGNIDTYLEAYDSRGNYICENDDGGLSSNARIDLLADAGASFLIKLRGYGGGTRGPYQIFADIKYYPEMTNLPIGMLMSGDMEYGREVWYYIKTANAGFLMVETLSDFDIYLEMYNEYLVLCENYNYTIDGLIKRIDLEIKPGMNLFFKIKSPDISGISAEGIDKPPEKISYQIMASLFLYPEPVQLVTGSFLNGFIDYAGEYWYSVRTEKDGYLIVETTGNTDTYLDAYDEFYNWIDSNDDGIEHYNARLIIHAQASQTYIFRLRGYSRDITGSYRIFANLK